MGQTKLSSLKEAVMNTGIGFVMSLMLQVYLSYRYSMHLTLFENLQVTIWFTILSIVRSYVVRRINNYWQLRDAKIAVATHKPATFRVPGCSVDLADSRSTQRERQLVFGDPGYIPSIDN